MHTGPIGETGQLGRTTRRNVVIGLVSGAGVLAVGGPPRAIAQAFKLDARPGPQVVDGFFMLSQALTGHSDIDPVTAIRLSAGFARTDPVMLAAFQTLVPLAKGQDPAGVMKAADAAGLGSAARGLLAGWYTGTIGSGPTAEVVSDVDALMHWTVRDAMVAETYCFGGPAWWVQPPPPIGIATPREAAAARSALALPTAAGAKAQ